MARPGSGSDVAGDWLFAVVVRPLPAGLARAVLAMTAVVLAIREGAVGATG